MSSQAISPERSFFNRILRYRWLLAEFVSRDLRLRYRGSVLGFAWTLLNPLLFMAVYTLVFGVYLRIGIKNYPVYLLSGLMAWNWFASAVQAGTSSILDGRMYVGKTVFPTEVLIFVPVISNLVNFLLSLPFLCIVIFLYHQPLGWPLMLLPLLILAQGILTAGILFMFATLNVYFRDFQQLVVYLVMLLFYMIPIFYTAEAIPDRIRPWVLANPLAVLIEAYQAVFYYNRFPDLSQLVYLGFGTLVVFLAGRAVFIRHRENMGEYL